MITTTRNAGTSPHFINLALVQGSATSRPYSKLESDRLWHPEIPNTNKESTGAWLLLDMVKIYRIRGFMGTGR